MKNFLIDVQWNLTELKWQLGAWPNGWTRGQWHRSVPVPRCKLRPRWIEFNRVVGPKWNNFNILKWPSFLSKSKSSFSLCEGWNEELLIQPFHPPKKQKRRKKKKQLIAIASCLLLCSHPSGDLRPNRHPLSPPRALLFLSPSSTSSSSLFPPNATRAPPNASSQHHVPL